MNMKWLLIGVVISFVVSESRVNSVEYVNPQGYRVEYSVIITNVDASVNDIQVWMPYPKEYDPQTNVNVSDIQPGGYQLNTDWEEKAMMLYWIRYDEPQVGDSTVFFEQFDYVCFEINSDVDTMNIPPYDTTTLMYKVNTKSERFIESNDQQIRDLVQVIVGEEKNPYLNARKFYDWIIDSLFYQDVEGLKGALFALINSYGECGDYSALFVAFCRAAGIPARPVVGFWAETGRPCHVWAEFYIEECGWVPVDVTVADTWGDPDYYFGNLDNRR